MTHVSSQRQCKFAAIVIQFFRFFFFFVLFLGGIGLLWSILWFLIVFETPASHPRISREELEEIETAIGTSQMKKKPTYVPWADIFTAPCVWAIVITHGTSVFGYFTIVNQLPTYMKEILHFDIKQVSNLYICCFSLFLKCINSLRYCGPHCVWRLEVFFSFLLSFCLLINLICFVFFFFLNNLFAFPEWFIIVATVLW